MKGITKINLKYKKHEGQNVKKLISLLLAFTMIFAMAIPTQALGKENEAVEAVSMPQDSEESLIYNDIANHWAKTEIEKWSNYGIIKGSDSLFRPGSSITRGEMAVIIDRLMKYRDKADNTFHDLDTSWYTEAILKANSAGIILGSNGQVRPNDLITREEAVVMLGRALRIDESGISSGFLDSANISSWSEGYVNAMSLKGIVNGVGNNSFAPKNNITRGEVIKILDNAIKGFYNAEGTYSENSAGDVIINAANVTLKDMEVRGKLIVAEGVGEGEVYLDNVRIKGDIIVKGGGKNSVYFNNVTVEGALIVNKVGGNLRIVATGTTSVSVAVLESGAILVTKDIIGGGIEKVEIPANIAAGQNIVLQGYFKTVENNSSGIKIEATGKIDNLVLNESATVSGKAEIASVTTAKGADSVINGKEVAGGQTGAKVTDDSKNTTGGGSGGNSSGGDSNNEEPVHVTSVKLNKSSITMMIGESEILVATISPDNATTKSAIWSTSDSNVAAVTQNGRVTAVSTGSAIITVTTIDGNKTASCTVAVVEEEEPGWQPPVEVDSRFAPGYPQASVNANDKIELKVKLVSPGEIFMTVNQMNSHINSTAEAVIHGHAGEDFISYVDDTAYINISDTNEHTLQTDVVVTGKENIKIYFVVKDGDRTSSIPTMIEFTAETVSELDNRPPRFQNAFINTAENKILMHFDEELDDSVTVNISEFSLSNGTVTGAAIKNYQYSNRKECIVELSVNEITNIENLKISYEGMSLKDKAATPNKVGKIDAKEVLDATVSIKNDEVYASHNGQYININFDKSLKYKVKEVKHEVIVKYGSDKSSAKELTQGEYELYYSHSNNGSSMQISIKLNEIPELENGYKYFITIDPNGMKDFADDEVSIMNVSVSPRNAVESSVKPKSVKYDSEYQEIIVEFEEESDMIFDYSLPVCFFNLNAGSKEYVLRGFALFEQGNKLFIGEKSFPFDPLMIDWENTTLSYSLNVHPDASIHDCLTFKSGMPYEGFNDFKITVE